MLRTQTDGIHTTFGRRSRVLESSPSPAATDLRTAGTPWVQRDAAQLIRSRARSFYVASLFLPPHIRRDVQIVYAYFRTVDDLVDEPPHGWSRADVLAALQSWEDGLSGRSTGPGALCHAMCRIANRYSIPEAHLRMVLDGARFDLDMRCIETREQLLQYSVQVAGSVGMVMAQVLGAEGSEAIEAACSLGVAMQLTNVLRDVGEDLDRGRVYLPREDLLRRGCGPEELQARSPSPALRAVMSDLAEEARILYQRGMDGIHYLDPSAQFAIRLAATLYSRILDKIARQDFDTFARRAHLTGLEKWMLALPAYVQHRKMAGM